MRKLAALSALLVAAAIGATFAVASGGRAVPKPGLTRAIEQTEQATSERYAIHVRLTRGNVPLTLHVRGRASRDVVSLKMRMSDLRLSDGTRVPGPSGAAMLDGTFVYEHAPSNMGITGPVQWLRLSEATASEDVGSVRAMTPGPLLRLLRSARIAPSPDAAKTFHGVVAYDEPAMRRLSKLTSGMEFRHLRIAATVGADRRLHRIVLTGRTADGKTTLSLRADLFGFGKPFHVTPPAPGTFMDGRLAALTA
jgi:hypothetical protein